MLWHPVNTSKSRRHVLFILHAFRNIIHVHICTHTHTCSETIENYQESGVLLSQQPTGEQIAERVRVAIRSIIHKNKCEFWGV